MRRVQFVTHRPTTTQVKVSNQNWRTSIYGVYPEYVDIRDWPIKKALT